MLVAAILMKVAAPSFGNWIGNQRIRSTAEAVLYGLNTARTEALRRNARVLFSMAGANGGQSAWSVCQVVAAGVVCDAAVPVIQARDGGEESGNARIGASTDLTLVAAGAFGTAIGAGAGVPVAVMFDGRGRVMAADGWANTVRIDVRDTGLAAADERRMVVVINASGSARMCDPLAVVGNPRAC
jgi:type IV fimbrial biogenesis protein FimT